MKKTILSFTYLIISLTIAALIAYYLREQISAILLPILYVAKQVILAIILVAGALIAICIGICLLVSPFFFYKLYLNNWWNWFYTPERIKKAKRRKVLDELLRLYLNHPHRELIKKRLNELPFSGRRLAWY